MCGYCPSSIYADGSETQCDLSLWYGNRTIAWYSARPPTVTIQAVNYTGGCNTLVQQGNGGIRLWVDVEKGHVTPQYFS
jgi:hypothetical protein